MTRRKPSHSRQVAALDATDYGATGPAAQARPSKIVAVEGKQVSSVRSEPVLVRRYTNECRIDYLNSYGQISDRQWRAGIRFRFHWTHSALSPTTVGQYGHEPKGHSLLRDSEALINHRQMVDQMLAEMTDRERAAVIAVAGQDESCAGRLYALQSALSTLADALKIDPDYSR